MRAKLFQLFKRLDKTEPFSETIWFLFLTLPAWIYLVMTTATPFTRFYVITQFFGYTLGLLLVIWMVTTLVVPSLIYSTISLVRSFAFETEEHAEYQAEEELLDQVMTAVETLPDAQQERIYQVLLAGMEYSHHERISLQELIRRAKHELFMLKIWPKKPLG